ncbi:phage major capsid protein, P2 family [Acinetobacter silvestris]|uniref:Phage major capsid protein, P2 family n=1 Tax=Acinetobacter silvestris TaxID=1977882 RepID=A0A1Y3CJ76_9GAMM|nr:phage major capsid protein, P2 family [Acinetobacter silvestris]OTG65934.1 phage major capsid protein, P2 family [Acinetobacter silvestris]
MRNDTRKKFNHSLNKLAEINGVEAVNVQFTIAPVPSQKMEEKVQASSEFLGKINIIGVINQTGEAIGLSVNSTIAGRTDTSGSGERSPTDPTGFSADKYECKQTNFDVAITYVKLDAWAVFADFHTRWTAAVAKAIALDRIMIGFNGTSVAETTDRTANPKLQDVNIGWLQKIRVNAAERVMKPVTVGTTGTYKNLDALVVDAVNELIDEVHQDDTDLVVICGRSLLADKNFPIVNDAADNQNTLAGQILLSQKQIGGLPAARVPHFPDNAMLITSFDNLSIYYQKDAKRRHIQEKPNKNRIEDYQSSNEAYVIEAYEKVALVEGITIQ